MMCDFHSVLVDRTGRIYHRPSNSHNDIAVKAGLENKPFPAEPQFWEAEWDGRGAMPADVCQVRYHGYAPDSVERAARRHYEKLAQVVNGQTRLVPPFGRKEYTDVLFNSPYGRSADGYDKDGYDKDGYDRGGIDREGYDMNGYDRNGYDENGYDENGYDKDGYDKDGYDRGGIDREGYDKDGYNWERHDRGGIDREGYDRYGYPRF